MLLRTGPALYTVGAGEKVDEGLEKQSFIT